MSTELTRAPPEGWRAALSTLRRSLRVRLLLGTLLWITIALVTAGFVLTAYFREYAISQFENATQIHLDQLAASFDLNEQGEPMLRTPLTDPRFMRPLSGLYWQINNPSGLDAMRSRSLWDSVLVLPGDQMADGELHFHTIRGPDGKDLKVVERTVHIADRPSQDWRLVVAAEVQDLNHTVGDWTHRLVLFLLILFISLALAAVAQVLIGLAPLRALQTALQRLSGGPLRRLEGEFPHEVQPLINDFNSVLDHSVRVVKRARAEAGDLAHAIKTPLAVMANAADHDRRADGPVGDLARLVADQVTTLQQQVEWRLRRARATATTEAPRISTPIAPIITQLVRVMERVHAERRLRFEVKITPDDLCFRGEAQDLQEILGNLIDNACKWATLLVCIHASVVDCQLTIVIDDDGPGLDPAQRDAVIQRGVRLDEQVPGSGLGLAIAKDLVSLYEGKIALSQSPLGGLSVSVTF